MPDDRFYRIHRTARQQMQRVTVNALKDRIRTPTRQRLRAGPAPRQLARTRRRSKRRPDIGPDDRL